MANEFHLPDIGEGLTEAVIVAWHVAVGAEVDMDAPLVEVETDKAVVDIPSPYAGTLLHQGAAEGETIAVDALLAVVGEPEEQWHPQPQGTDAGMADDAPPVVGRLDSATETIVRSQGRPQILPRLRRLADELEVDLATIVGTGSGGRITEDDIRAGAAPQGPQRRTRMSPTRRAIAENLTRSWREIPHVTTYDEVDAEPLLAARGAAGKPPLEALLIARITPLLGEFPLFNASVAGDEIIEHLRYDIGFAVDTPEGLLVAVIRDADGLDVGELAGEVSRLARAARDRTIRPDELRGQTFTISNIGAVGGRFGTPVVPYGTTAILSIGRADPAPVVRDGHVVVGREFPLSLSYDHRVIDGALGRAFLAAVAEALT